MRTSSAPNATSSGRTNGHVPVHAVPVAVDRALRQMAGVERAVAVDVEALLACLSDEIDVPSYP